MLNWLKSTLHSAGFGAVGLPLFTICAIAGALITALGAYQFVNIPVFAFSCAVGFLGLMLELLSAKARSRQRAIASAWPEVIDSLASAASAGLSTTDSLIDLAELGPEILRPYFQTFSQNLNNGFTPVQSLAVLKRNLGDVHSDRLIEVISIANSAGGSGFHEALRTQATLTRRNLALWGEIESKQGWVSGTAKIAVAAPWLIVLMLSSRPENAAAYASETGTLVLFIGLIVSVFAYRLIQFLGSIAQPRRIFTA
jgi:tight adherence protein B